MNDAVKINRLPGFEMTGRGELEKQYVTAFFIESHERAEAAVKEIGRSDADIQILSISDNYVHYGEPDFENYNTGNRLNFWIRLGAFWLA